jgi:hypothetical protein
VPILAVRSTQVAEGRAGGAIPPAHRPSRGHTCRRDLTAFTILLVAALALEASACSEEPTYRRGSGAWCDQQYGSGTQASSNCHRRSYCQDQFYGIFGDTLGQRVLRQMYERCLSGHPTLEEIRETCRKYASDSTDCNFGLDPPEPPGV